MEPALLAFGRRAAVGRVRQGVLILVLLAAVPRTGSGQPLPSVADSAYNSVLSRFKHDHPKVTVLLGDWGTPVAVDGKLAVGSRAASTEELAYLFFNQNKDIFRMTNPHEELQPSQRTHDPTRHLWFDQWYHGVRVKSGAIGVHFDSTKSITGLSSGYFPDITLDPVPKLPGSIAENIALTVVRDSVSPSAVVIHKELVVFPMTLIGPDHTYRLAWSVVIDGGDKLPGASTYFVDALTGKLFSVEPGGVVDRAMESQGTPIRPSRDSLGTNTHSDTTPPTQTQDARKVTPKLIPQRPSQPDSRSADSSRTSPRARESPDTTLQLIPATRTKPHSTETAANLNNEAGATPAGFSLLPDNDPGWTTVLFEDFEGTFPPPSGQWDRTADPSGTATWDDVNCISYSGDWSGWCAGTTYSCEHDYPNSIHSWMTGHFSGSDAYDCRFSFYYNNQIYDNADFCFFGSSTDNVTYDGYYMLAPSAGWTYVNYFLTSCVAQPNAWIDYEFQSDTLYTDLGTYVDDIRVELMHLPDLQCTTPSGWQNNIVISSTYGSYTQASQLYAGQTYYVNFAWTNSGNAWAGTHTARLYRDGDLIMWSQVEGQLGSGVTAFVSDEPYVFPAGTFTLSLRLDEYDTEVVEYDETNNECTLGITVGCSAGGPALGEGCSLVGGTGFYKDELHTSCTGTGTAFEMRDRTTLAHGNSITTHFAQGSTLPGPIATDADNVWDNSSQCAAVDAQEYSRLAVEYMHEVLAREGWDTHDAAMKNTIDYAVGGCTPDLASGTIPIAQFWNQQVEFCYPGNDPERRSAAGCLDQVGHEWAHGITFKESGLQVTKEPGALNESFSNMFGAAVSGYGTNVQYDFDQWILGEYIRTTDVSGVAWMHEPRLGPGSRPDTYLDFAHGWQDPVNCIPDADDNDNCYTHSNAGVMDKMFYLFAEGGRHNNITVLGVGVDLAMQIMYLANRDYWYSGYTFAESEIGVVSAAAIMDPTGVAGYRARRAYAAVGVICGCASDPNCDGVTNASDVVLTIDRAFRGVSPTVDAPCPFERTDLNCDGASDVLDVTLAINVAFRGAPAASVFCSRGVLLN